ncbi:MAG: hypothetical protein HRT69_14730 [Flavobacteriaceae bacterium]|nr:hypothetical protein [Flavobacteriaceae bacterium]
MRKKLHFDGSFNVNRSLYILIDNGEIREYEGADFSPLIIFGKPQPEFKTFYLKLDFKLIKVSKYDQKKLNIKANYKIECNYFLSVFLITTPYIKLNSFEKFRIDYSKKESILHKMNFNQKLISALSFVTIPFLFSVLLSYCTNNNTKALQIQSPNPDLKTIKQNRNIPIIIADSVSVQTEKFDRDSLLLGSINNNVKINNLNYKTVANKTYK